MTDISTQAPVSGHGKRLWTPHRELPTELVWEHLGFHSSCRTIAAIGDTVFFGTFSGLFRKEAGTVERMGWSDQSLVLASVRIPGRLYVGGYEGLWIVDQTSGGWSEPVHLIREQGIVHGFGESEDGSLWIRMGEGRVGLAGLDSRTLLPLPVKVLGTAEGLATWWINPLIVGNRVFASSPQSMMEYDREAERFVEAPGVLYFPGEGPFLFPQELSLEDGSRQVTRNDALANLVPYPERSPAAALQFFSETIDSRASAISSTGDMDAYATVNGVVLVRHLSSATRSLAPPRLTLRSVADFTQNRILATNLVQGIEHPMATFPSYTRNIRFRFTLDRYWDSQDHSFQFYLEGFDKEWNYFLPQSEKEYTNLKPGRYVFMVRGRDRNLVESELVHYTFRIRSPWFLAWWAWAGYLSLVTSLIYLGILIREAGLRRTNKYLQVEVDLRTADVLTKAAELERKNLELQVALIQSNQLQKEAQAASIAKGRFLATMSHEIRTPMNGVIGMCELLDHTRLDSHQAALLMTIRRSGESLLNILNGILDFSKIEAGKLTLEHVPVCIRTCAEEVLELMAWEAHQKESGTVARL
jgi:hypothetical protein